MRVLKPNWFLEYLSGIETHILGSNTGILFLFLEYLSGIETISGYEHEQVRLGF